MISFDIVYRCHPQHLHEFDYIYDKGKIRIFYFLEMVNSFDLYAITSSSLYFPLQYFSWDIIVGIISANPSMAKLQLLQTYFMKDVSR